MVTCSVAGFDLRSCDLVSICKGLPTPSISGSDSVKMGYIEFQLCHTHQASAPSLENPFNILTLGMPLTLTLGVGRPYITDNHLLQRTINSHKFCSKLEPKYEVAFSP